MLYIFMAFIAGWLIVLSMIFNSNLAKKIGIFQSTLINYTVGLFVSGLLALVMNRQIDISLLEFNAIPWWAYLGGLVGVAIVSASNYIIPKIPVIYTTLLVYVGQLTFGLTLDYLSGFPISRNRLIGGTLIIIGLLYNFRIDQINTGEADYNTSIKT